MPEIEVLAVSKSYGKFKAVDNVSFRVKKGEIIGLVGESGCGKSTMTNIINGLIKPDKGQVLFDGKDISEFGNKRKKEYRQNVQTIFQDSAASLNPRCTVGLSIAEPIENFFSLSKEEIKGIVMEALKKVGLSEKDYDKYPKKLSGGQRQRVAIARAIVLKPQFVLMDEITSSLDVSIQAQILNLVQDLKEEHGLGAVFISHDIGVVRHMCDKVFVMYRGCIVEEIEGEKIKEAVHPYSKMLLDCVPHIGNNDFFEKNDFFDMKMENRANGCVFYERCVKKDEKCRDMSPELKSYKENHKVSCFNL